MVKACQRYGTRSIIALSGVPGTGKSFVARRAAKKIATGDRCVREIQFHPSYSYEEFIQGYRADPRGKFVLANGSFLEWNYQAEADSDNKYVLLIEELARANLPSVLGELLTYIEYRGDHFRTLYAETPVRVQPNLTIIATFNPRDRSALEMDDALVRRLRIIDCPPDPGQLSDMLKSPKSNLPDHVVAYLGGIFGKCEEHYKQQGRPEDYDRLMPFGHGIFAEVQGETPDLHQLWEQRIKYLLVPPARARHPLYQTIADAYPWRDKDYVMSPTPAQPAA